MKSKPLGRIENITWKISCHTLCCIIEDNICKSFWMDEKLVNQTFDGYAATLETFDDVLDDFLYENNT